MTLSSANIIVVLVFIAFSLCSAKSVGFKNLASLAQVSTLNDETVACQRCKEIVIALDKHGGVFNSSEEMAQALQERCPQMPHGSPDEAFCKALEGKYDVFAKAYFQHRDNTEIDPCQVAQICGPSFNHLASLSHVFALSEETSACQRCTEIVTKLDHYEISTPEEMAKALQKRCLLEGQSSSNKQFCKAIQGKYDVFAKAYFQHRDNPEVDPCKVAGICTAKSVGLNNLASLSQDFALSNACEDCNYFVAFADKSPQMPKDRNTPEKLAKVLQDTCEPPEAELCKALEGKFLVFAKAYFQHRDDPQVDPCKVAQVC